MTDAPPSAAVLIIGDEILSGRTREANLAVLARFLGTFGIEVAEARVVGDRPDRIVGALNALRGAHDFVFTSGGIGPTHDDITADCVARAFGVPLDEHPDALAILERRYGDQLNAARRRMARIPRGGVLIANPVTDAPGFRIDNVFVLAGVPAILRGMLEDVAHRLPATAVVHARAIRVTGAGEGDIAGVLAEAATAAPALSFGSYPFGHGTGGEVGSELVVRGRDEAAVQAAADDLLAALADAGITAAPTAGKGG